MSKQEGFPSEGRKVGKVICAWCDKDLGEKEGVIGTSHGICSECRSFASEKEIKKEISRESWQEAIEITELIANPYLGKKQILKLLIMKHRSLIAVFAQIKINDEFPLEQLPEITQKLKEYFKLE